MITPWTMAKSGKEDAEQSAFFCWLGLPDSKCIELKLPLHPIELSLMFAIPNGGLRDKITAGKMKATGTRAGVLDTFLPIPVGGYHGLWIEFKVGKNTLSAEQKEFRKAMEYYKYKVAVCYTWQEAIAVVLNYLTGVI